MTFTSVEKCAQHAAEWLNETKSKTEKKKRWKGS